MHIGPIRPLWLLLRLSMHALPTQRGSTHNSGLVQRMLMPADPGGHVSTMPTIYNLTALKKCRNGQKTERKCSGCPAAANTLCVPLKLLAAASLHAIKLCNVVKEAALLAEAHFFAIHDDAGAIDAPAAQLVPPAVRLFFGQIGTTVGNLAARNSVIVGFGPPFAPRMSCHGPRCAALQHERCC
eukprot:scaffold250517_cov44-Prasinocladus_malaysianus.AAC.3